MMASRSSHRSPKPRSSEMVDFKSLVWPPPELRPPSTVTSSDDSTVPVERHPRRSLGRNVLLPVERATQSEVASSMDYHEQRLHQLGHGRPIMGSECSSAGYHSARIDDLRSKYPQSHFQNHRSVTWGGTETSIISCPLDYDERQENRPPFQPPRPPTPYHAPAGIPVSESSSGSASTTGKGRFGCKDFPAGYSPTPRPVTPPTYSYRGSQMQQPQPSYSHSPLLSTSRSRSAQPASSGRRPMGFFEPTGPTSNSYYPTTELAQLEDFVVPVIENGTVVSHCRVPGKFGLSPGGYIDPSDSSQAGPSNPPSTQFRSRGPPSTNTLGVEGLTPSPLHYGDDRIIRSVTPSGQGYFYLPDQPRLAREEARNQLLAYEEMNDLTRRVGTRKGMWNRRGDELSVMGHVKIIPDFLSYPPDLDKYPTHSFMDENGRVFLPEKNQNRIIMWRDAGEY